MARKIFGIACTLAVFASLAAFGTGQKEPAPAQGAPAQSSPAPSVANQKLVLTGNVYLQNEQHPVLKSGGKEYELMVPRYLVWNLDVKEGEEVTVEGYQVQGMPMHSQDDGDIDVFVTKATFRGKEFDLSGYRGEMARGGRGQMMRGGGMWGGGGRGYRL